MSARTLASSNGLARRNLRNIRRLPSAFIPGLVMPLVQTIAFSGTFFAITQLPGFPTDRSINWYMPLALVMGCSFTGMGVGWAMIRDLESGFYDRIRMAPAPRRSLVLGPVFAAVARSIIVVVLVMLLGWSLGARLTGGPIGLVTLTVAGLGVALIGAGWGLGLAYRFGDMRGGAIMQLSMFLVLFLSSAQAPLEIIEGWLHPMARINPFTNVFRLARAGFLEGVTWDQVWGGLLALGGMGVASLWFARRGLDRLTR